MRHVARLAAIGALLLSTGCTQPTMPTACPAGMGAPTLVFTLFFGQTVPGRHNVTSSEWQHFLETTLTPNLPNGYTQWDAHGAWMNPMTRKTIQEPTKVVLVALPFSQRSLDMVNRVRQAYQEQFRQQLVGMTSDRTCGAF